MSRKYENKVNIMIITDVKTYIDVSKFYNGRCEYFLFEIRTSIKNQLRFKSYFDYEM